MNLKLILPVAAFYLLVSCNRNTGSHGSAELSGEKSFSESSQLELEPIEYMSWIQDTEHGLKKEKVIDDITFSAQYKPLAYIACMEERKNAIQESVLKEKEEELKGMQYYDLKISLSGEQTELLKYKLQSGQEYQDRVNYFAFKMQKDISLVEGSDTVPCALYHFERAYDVAPYAKFLLGFPLTNKKDRKEKTLVFHDEIFKKGIIKLSFSPQQLINVPKLKTI